MIIKGSLETNKQKARLYIAEIIIRDYLAGNTTDLSGKNYVCMESSFLDFTDVDDIHIGTKNNYKYNMKNMKEYDITEKIKPKLVR